MFYFFVETVISVFFAAILLSHSALLMDGSKLYTRSLVHRLQTDAFLNGHLSLSPLPFGYQPDFNWSGHGLQQAYGLGIPSLRFPFEWAAKYLGLGPFPDRLVLLFYLLVTVVILNISIRLILKNSGLNPAGVQEQVIRWYLMAWIFLSPALGVLIQSKLNNFYYETVLYGFLYAYFLLSLFWAYIINCNGRIFIILCLFSGLGWLIRPTLIFYGFTAVALAVVAAHQNKRPISQIVTGVMCFCLSMSADLWFNYLRFGSIFEFGYSANFGPTPVENYSLRFSYPFKHEPFLSAAKELIEGLFFNKSWESPTIRDRWYMSGYAPAFNSSYLIIIAGGALVFILFLAFRFLKQRDDQKLSGVYWRVIYLSLVWGLISSALLFVFYMHAPITRSRYLSEFSPAFNAIFIALILLICSRAGLYFKDKRVLILFFAICCILFYTANRRFFHFDNQLFYKYHRGELIDKTMMVKLLTDYNRGIHLRPYLPETSYCHQSYAPPGLMYQNQGWNIHTDCLVYAVTSAFLPMKRCVNLDFIIRTDRPPDIKVKRDLVYLKLFDSRMKVVAAKDPKQEEMTQRFCTDEPTINPVALYSVGWVSPEGLNQAGNGTLPVKLNWIKVSAQ